MPSPVLHLGDSSQDEVAFVYTADMMRRVPAGDGQVGSVCRSVEWTVTDLWYNDTHQDRFKRRTKKCEE